MGAGGGGSQKMVNSLIKFKKKFSTGCETFQ